MSSQFECVLCSEVRNEEPHLIGLFPLCIRCTEEDIVPLFEKALKYEYAWPPQWGNLVIDISNFKDLLSAEFFDRYIWRETNEYKIAVNDRLYCSHSVVGSRSSGADPINALDIVGIQGLKAEKCNTFLGGKNEQIPGRAALRTCCSTCSSFSCRCCGEALADSESLHACKPAEDDMTAFDGLVKGIAWQECPHCLKKIELSEACNEITCTCTGHFCFICGEPTAASGETNHWTKPGCPRFGTVATATNQHFDETPLLPNSTPEQFREAAQLAWEDESTYPSFDNPDEELPNLRRNIGLVRDRDFLRSAIDDLRPQLNDDIQENIVWRHETLLFLTVAADSLDLLLIVGHAPRTVYREFLGAFERNQSVLFDKGPQVPQEYLQENFEIADILEDVVESVDTTLVMLRRDAL